MKLINTLFVNITADTGRLKIMKFNITFEARPELDLMAYCGWLSTFRMDLLPAPSFYSYFHFHPNVEKDE